MLFTLAVLCFLLVNVGANECQCFPEREDTSCKKPMRRIVQALDRKLKWDNKMYQRAKQEAEDTVTKTPEYVAAFFQKFFETTDKNSMAQKVNITMDRGRLSSRMKLVREGTKFGCYCEYFTARYNDMMIYCFFG
ncbi:hypothetical protein TELCIR_15090 [Teladorsagia circumcincta]|uniref:SCP domain-containing protein n=1 Tax=Teladorsagia circumcincta TaxID=45464 RepID=A0A2G9U1D2_TELCI|nr:hypothetical protein TELCIR_15090 [Teladorsagia circumcincta]